MPEPLKLYLDQMLRLDVGQALRGEGQSYNFKESHRTSPTIFTPSFFRGI